MKYAELLAATHATGVQAYDQADEAHEAGVNINNGVCRALVIRWLQSKRENKDLWAGRSNRGTHAEPLLTSYKALEDALNLQNDYGGNSTGRYVPDVTTNNTLASDKIRFDIADTIGNQFGFAITKPDNPNSIATKVLTAASRFFILSVAGTSGAHSIGMYRPYSLFGKSSQCYLFDPNVGEMFVEGQEAVEHLLSAVNGVVYQPSHMDLNKSFILWAYKVDTSDVIVGAFS